MLCQDGRQGTLVKTAASLKPKDLDLDFIPTT